MVIVVQITHNKFLEIIWTLVPISLLVMIAIPSMNLLYSMNEPSSDPKLTVRITGHQWYWNYSYASEKPWLTKNVTYNKNDMQDLYSILILNKLKFW